MSSIPPKALLVLGSEMLMKINEDLVLSFSGAGFLPEKPYGLSNFRSASFSVSLGACPSWLAERL